MINTIAIKYSDERYIRHTLKFEFNNLQVIDIPNVCYVHIYKNNVHSYEVRLFRYNPRYVDKIIFRSLKEMIKYLNNTLGK